MKFQNPAALWALLLIAIPIIIHLFNFRRYKKVYFSNLAFLRNVQQQQKSTSTLKKLLILATRILAVTFLVLAFAQPVFLSEDETLTTGSVAVYIDNSLSMQQSSASGEPLLYVAATAASNLITDLKTASQLTLTTNDYTKVLTNPEDATELLSAPEFSNKSLHLSQLAEKLSQRHLNQLVIFSDLQRSTALPLDELTEDTSRQITIYKVAAEPHGNLFIDTVYLDKPLGLTTENQVHFQLRNTGEEPANDVLVKLQRNGNQISSLTTKIPAGSYSEVSLDIGVNENISGDYTISIQDNPVTFDNTFYFHISESDKPLVVLLTSDESKPNPFEFVFGNDQYFTFVKNSVDNASFQEITRADLLIVDGLDAIPSWLVSQYDQLTGSVLLVPTINAETTSYAQLFGSGLSKNETPTKSILRAKSLEHPFFDGIFTDKNERMDLPTAQVLFNLSGNNDVMLSTAAGQPFLVKSVISNTYLLTTPLADDYTNLHKHALFVPLMYRMAQQGVNPPLAYRLDDALITIDAPSISRPEIIELKNGENIFVPSFRLVNNQLLITLPDVLTKPGFYTVVTQNDTLKTLALNYNKKESDISPIEETELQLMLAGFDHIQVRELNTTDALLNANTNGSQSGGLWKYALILALIFLLTESLLLRFLR